MRAIQMPTSIDRWIDTKPARSRCAHDLDAVACSLLRAHVAMRRPGEAEQLRDAFTGEVAVVSGEYAATLDDFAFADTVMVPDLPLPPSHREPPAPPVSQRRAQVRSAITFLDFEWQRDDVLRATLLGIALLVLFSTAAAIAAYR